MKQVLIFYSEIAIKGKNRKEYEKKLKQNIQRKSRNDELTLTLIKKKGTHFFCIFENSKDEIKNSLKDIFGITYFSFVEEIGKNPDKFFEKIYSIIDSLKEKSINELNIQTKRTDKNFPFNSIEINKKIGDYCRSNDIKINFKNKQNIIYIRINLKSIYFYHEKHLGLNGLPANSSGRALVLLSGGIDSPVAAYSMLSRGLHCDFLHFHNFKENSKVLDSKITETINIINKYQFGSKLYTIPYYLFDLSVINNRFDNYNLIFFKYYILKLADIIAEKYDYLAIVTGDSLGQVASQTLENINTTSCDNQVQIFRPLISYDKEDIISIAKQINTFELSTQEYKDCCSLVAKNPITKSKIEKFKRSISEINLEELFEKSLEKMEVFDTTYNE